MSDTRQTHSPETKAAVMAALLLGQSVSQVASQYKVPVGTVKRWSAEAKGQLEPVRAAKKDRIGELLLSYLETSLVTLQTQVGLFADEGWLFKQPASEAAVLHGVIADKAIRLLEALADDGEADEGA